MNDPKSQPDASEVPATAAELRAATFFTATIPFFGRPRVFELRALDLQTMLWEGIVTQTLVSAAERFSELHALYQRMGGDGAGVRADMAVYEAMSEQEKQQLRGLLERYAVSACVQPAMTFDAADRDKYPVTNAPMATLLAIFQASPEKGAPRITPTAAGAFRPEESPADGGDGRDGTALRPPAEPLAADPGPGLGGGPGEPA